jgi:phage FluMu protein Com
MGTITIRCSCGKILRVDEKYAGRRGKCPSCNAEIHIPTPIEPPISTAPSAASENSATPRPASWRRPFLLGTGAGASFVLCIVALLAVIRTPEESKMTDSAEPQRVTAELAKAKGNAEDERPETPPVRQAPKTVFAGTVAFKDGTSRSFTEMRGLRVHLIRESPTFVQVPGRLVIQEFKDGFVAGESTFELADIESFSVNRRGENTLSVEIVGKKGTKDTVESTGLLFQVKWAESIRWENILIADHSDSEKYLGITVRLKD